MAEPLAVVKAFWKSSNLGPHRLIPPTTEPGHVTHGWHHPQSHIWLVAKGTGTVAAALMILLGVRDLQLSLASSLSLPLQTQPLPDLPLDTAGLQLTIMPRLPCTDCPGNTWSPLV